MITPHSATSASRMSQRFSSDVAFMAMSALGTKRTLAIALRMSAFRGKANVRQYATGLGALGLIGWRRKMKTQAAAA